VHKIRVMSYNLHSSRDDLGALAAVVRSQAPDVVLAQEAPHRFRWRARSAGLARDWGLLFAGGGGPWSAGNAIFTSLRVNVHDTWNIRFPLVRGRHMRGAVFARCSVGRTRFVVVGTHLSLDPAERASQATLLKEQLAQLEEPVVVGGDLNEESSGAGWGVLLDGLVDPAVARDCHHLPTFSCANPRRRIDGIFVDSRCEVLDYRVVDSPEAMLASDHFPVVADLLLPQ